MFRIYVANLGKYNEGELIGEWVDLPVNDEELEAVEKRIGINQYYEEMFITDYESDIDGVHVNEYDNINELNEIAEEINNFDDCQIEVFEALLSDGYEFDEALEKMDDAIVYNDCNDMEDVAIEYCEECGILDEIPEDLRGYFDFKAYGRDLDAEGHYIFTNNGNCVEVF